MNTVASTILQQLGGNRFAVFTGATQLVGGPDFLRFKIGRNAKGVNHVEVKLDPSDTYTVKFMSVRAGKVTVKAEISDVYAEDLRSVFTTHTGMVTSFAG